MHCRIAKEMGSTSLYHVFWCWIVRMNHLRQVEAQYQQQEMFANTNIIKTVIQRRIAA